MQIKKTYLEINPELLYQEIKDFAVKQGAIVTAATLETYSMPNDSASFITRGALTFKMPDALGSTEKESLSAHIVGSAKGETRLLFDFDEKAFSQQNLNSLQDDLDFMVGLYEVKPT